MLIFNFNPFPYLSTPRLMLRPVLKSDVKEIFILRSHPVVMKYIAKKHAESMEDAAAFIEKINLMENQNQCVTWAITLKEQGKLIGNIGFWNLQPENHRAEIGYTLMPEFHRNGIMFEAIQEVIKFGFNTLHLHSITGHVNPMNEGSVKLLERNNFIKEGHFKENQYYDGKFFDTLVYTLFSGKSPESESKP